MRGGAFFNGKEGRDDFRKTAQRAVTSPLPEVSVPRERGTEGGVKTIERGLGRKWSSPCRRDGEVEKTPSLTVRKDG